MRPCRLATLPGAAVLYGRMGGNRIAHRGEHRVRTAQLVPRIDPVVLAAEPLAIDGLRAGEFEAQPRMVEAIDPFR